MAQISHRVVLNLSHIQARNRDVSHLNDFNTMIAFYGNKDNDISYTDEEGNLIYSIQKMYETETFDFDHCFKAITST